MIPYFLYLLEKMVHSSYFELALSTKLCTILLFRSQLVIGLFQNLSHFWSGWPQFTWSHCNSVAKGTELSWGIAVANRFPI